MEQKRGYFITFEGTEGSGKSTQIKRVADTLRSIGYCLRELREPGGTPICEEVRHILKKKREEEVMTSEAELLLMNASRAQLVREVIRPALGRGEIVLCDRFYDSTTAYQGYGRQLGLQEVKQIIDFAVGDTKPDLTLLLNIPIELSQARRMERGGEECRFEEEDRKFFERVGQGYNQIAESEPSRVKIVNAEKRIDEVYREIMGHILYTIGRNS